MADIITVASPTAINVEKAVIRTFEIGKIKQELEVAYFYLTDIDSGKVLAETRKRATDNIARLENLLAEAVKLGLDTGE